VTNANSTKPPCPVIPHFEAVVSFTHLGGKFTYRWERSTGDSSKIREATIPAGAASGTATFAVEPDEWLDKDRGVQQTFTDKVHVLTPLNRTSSPLALQGICF